MSKSDFFKKGIRSRKMLLVPLIVLVLPLLFLAWVLYWPNTFHDPSERTIYVDKGASFQVVLDSLIQKGIVRDGWTFQLTAKIIGGTRSLKYGKYVFKSGISNASILNGIVSGNLRKMISVSLPEGMRIESIANRLGTSLGIRSDLIRELCSDSVFISTFEIKAKNLEGYLLPDTYLFHWKTEEREVVRRIVESFQQFYDEDLQEREKELRMTTRQVLALAAIIEGEARIDDDRAKVSGVYHNRLKKRMKLEADPTIQYIITNGPRRVLYKDLKIKSPYNTYLNYGLPPGPINNPGKKSILAALYPEEHDYLFFVSDGKRGHKFSKTYAEHLRAVKEFRRLRQANSRSSASNARTEASNQQN